jgi:hypothetical protein
LAGAVDTAALFGGVYLVSQLIAGGLRRDHIPDVRVHDDEVVELHILGWTLVFTQAPQTSSMQEPSTSMPASSDTS